MDHSLNESIQFGDCRLSEDGILVTPGGERHLSRRLAVTLCALVNSDGAIVSSDQLLDAFWGQGSGIPQNLAKAIFQLRQALADSRLVRIDSAYGHGYRLHVLKTAADIPDASARAVAICEEARHRIYDRRDIALNAALGMYEEALKLDAGCICAYTDYAEAQMQLMGTGQELSSAGWPAARQALLDALEHDPGSADAHALLALGQCLFDWDIDSALSALETAMSLAPGAYVPNEAAARIALFRGKPEGAVEHARRALLANPMAMNTRGILAFALECSDDPKAAREYIDEAWRFDPGNPMTQTYFTWIEAANGDAKTACEIGAQIHGALSNSATIASVYAFALASAGRMTEARLLLSSIGDKGKFATHFCAAATRAWGALGDRQAAIRELATCAQNRDYWLGIMLNHPANDWLRAEPGFQDIYEAVFGSRA